MIWACVSSLQDRGCILDAGLDVNLFVPTAETEAFVSVRWISLVNIRSN